MNKTLALFTFASAIMTALAVDHPWHYANRILPSGDAYELSQWKLVDKGWRPRVMPGGHWDGEFYPFNEHFDKWVILSTNAITRPISVVASSKFKDKIDEMEPGYKKQQALEKAARKFGKNIEKVRKDFEKYRDKASTEDERAFWQSLLDIIPVPNEG